MGRSELDRIEAEVNKEPAAIDSFGKSAFNKARAGSIFVGAGDSYAAGLAGFYASHGRCLALDPYTVASCPEIARNRDLFFISASGRTAANLAAAKSAKAYAAHTTAITAFEDSLLGKQTDETVLLPMRYLPRTPGFLSFALSLFAVLRISSSETSGNLARSFRQAERDSQQISFGEGTTFFLGNLLDHPVAVYSAAKCYEMLGKKAQPELLEEFSHLELFSLEQDDAVNVFSSFDPSAVASRLEKTLTDQGYRVKIVPSSGSTSMERVFHSVFTAQLAVLRASKGSGILKPKFLDSGGKLAASDSMIY